MANPSTSAPSAAVDEALRITADSSRRAADNARAAVDAARSYFDQTVDLNRQLFGVWSAGMEGGLKAAFDLQNAAMTSGLTLFDNAASINKDAIQRFAEVNRQAQQSTLKAYQAGARVVQETFAATTK